VKINPNAATPIIPEKTAVPSVCVSSAPAPVAHTSGTTPKTKASDVIKIGRSRNRTASTAAAQRSLELLGELDDQDRILRRKTNQHDEAALGEDVVVLPAQQHASDRGNEAHGHDEDHRQRQGQALVLSG
jgi:hypothetical protein